MRPDLPVNSDSAYGWIVLGLVLLGLWKWSRAARGDVRLLQIYLWGIIGAFLGAKVVYGFAEGWWIPDAGRVWLHWVAGKSILGGLLGGWLGVECAKRATGFTAPTGDRFAVMVAGSTCVGRVGCMLHGCCLGVPMQRCAWSVTDACGIDRWPAAAAELAFTGVCSLLLLVIRNSGHFRNQLFHLYLIGYGLFRAWHETLRDTPRWGGGVSGYQMVALFMAGLAAAAYALRARGQAADSEAGG